MDALFIVKAFQRKFNTTPTLHVRAPGRINLIGEHTDYNNGFVLPAAVDKAIYFSLKPRLDQKIRLYSVDLNDDLETDLNVIEKSEKSWANFLLGVINELLIKGESIDHGFDLAFGGDVPLGAGMSSSAAIESGMGLALNEMYGLGLSRLQLAKVAQMAEHHFAGLKCGIMDMYASLFGKSAHLIKLDCRSLTHEYLPFDFDDIAVVLFNSGVKHNLAESAYNKRREECEEGVKVLNTHFGDIDSLRDASLEQLLFVKAQMDKKVYNRCHFVISETERMMQATDALEKHDLVGFGRLMLETHAGLRDEYEVSCSELDFLVDVVKDESGVYGSRMMGGGFGGCTINLIKSSEADRIIDLVSQRYEERFGFIPDHYKVAITDGCMVVRELEKEKL